MCRTHGSLANSAAEATVGHGARPIMRGHNMYEFLKTWIELKTDRRAVTALEYGLIAGLVAVVIIGAVTSLGTSLSTKFSTIAVDV